MKKYGDDADSFHDQGTRVQESANWHRQNKIGGIYPHRSQPNPSCSRSHYSPSYTNKLANKPKSTYKPRYSNKSTNKPKSTYKPKYSNKSTYKATYSPSSNYSNRNRRTSQNRSTSSSSSSGDNLLMALLCICGILALWISAAFNLATGFPPIFIGLIGIVAVIFWIIEELPKKIKSYKGNNFHISSSSKIFVVIIIGLIFFISEYCLFGI